MPKVDKISPASTQSEQTWELIQLAEICNSGPEKIAGALVGDTEISKIANACITLDKELFVNKKDGPYYKYSPEYMNQLLVSAGPPPGVEEQVSKLFRPGNNSS